MIRSGLSRSKWRRRTRWVTASAAMAMVLMLVQPASARHSLPDEYDVREQYPMALSPVRNQGNCGAGWAHAAVGVIEARYRIKAIAEGDGVPFIDLSEQQLVSCVTENSFGCGGGSMEDALAYVRESGLLEESAFPYSASDESCPTFVADLPRVFLQSSGYERIGNWNNGIDFAQIEDIKYEILTNGPVMVGIYLDEDLHHYESGIHEYQEGVNLGTKAMEIVGWGEEGGIEYLTFKNSWGPGWGEGGYVRIKVDPSVFSWVALAPDVKYPGTEACGPGFYSSTGLEPCDLCPAGRYCPPGSTSSQGAGLCPPNTYCPAGSGFPTDCPAGTTSPLGSDSFEDCLPSGGTQQRSFPDTDGDGHLDIWDNCPADFNVAQLDRDGDGTGDECDRSSGIPGARDLLGLAPLYVESADDEIVRIVQRYRREYDLDRPWLFELRSIFDPYRSALVEYSESFLSREVPEERFLSDLADLIKGPVLTGTGARIQDAAVDSARDGSEVTLHLELDQAPRGQFQITLPRSIIRGHGLTTNGFTVMGDGRSIEFTQADSLAATTFEINDSGLSQVSIVGAEVGPRPPTVLEQALHLTGRITSLFMERP